MGAMNHANWVRITTNSRERYNEGYANLMRRRVYPEQEWTDEDRKKEAQRLEAIYREEILSAWDAYRPDGPLEGECLPHEVVRLRMLQKIKESMP